MSTIVREMRNAAKSSYTLGMVTAFLGLVAIVAPLFTGFGIGVILSKEEYLTKMPLCQ